MILSHHDARTEFFEARECSRIMAEHVLEKSRTGKIEQVFGTASNIA
jgi:hypothetical protein